MLYTSLCWSCSISVSQRKSMKKNKNLIKNQIICCGHIPNSPTYNPKKQTLKGICRMNKNQNLSITASVEMWILLVISTRSSTNLNFYQRQGHTSLEIYHTRLWLRNFQNTKTMVGSKKHLRHAGWGPISIWNSKGMRMTWLQNLTSAQFFSKESNLSLQAHKLQKL